MKFEILWKPSYSTLHLVLDQWEKIKVEPWSMVAMDSTATIEWKAEGWFLAWLSRKFLTWESFFVTTISANQNNSDVYLAPRSVWDIQTLKLDGTKNFIVQGGWFLAWTDGIQTDSKFQGLKWFFSWEWLFMIRVSWQGACFVSSFGAIIEYNITEEQGEFIVDNAHIVAFEDILDYSIEKAWKGLLNSIKTWEWLVTKFKWKGKVYIQTRNTASFAETLNPFLATNNSSWWNSGLLGWVFWD